MSHSTASPEVEQILSRLVAQFQSPYDFVRELVQNALDAGSDRIEVNLESYPGEGDECVFELEFRDFGRGMDEATIDGELTRLFSSGKRGDATQAGGFGIGFVSVFAWSPAAVLLQTGRAGEAWELQFSADRSFRKRVVEEPLEGTVIYLYRRGASLEREAIAESVRDALWRWCRFSPIELIFCDRQGDRGEELIAEEPQTSRGPRLLRDQGETRLALSWEVPSRATLLRRGLILAEGSAAELFPELRPSLGDALELLGIWCDSPLLRTTMQRDKVIDDEGRAAIAKRVVAAHEELTMEQLHRLQAHVLKEGEWSRDHNAQAVHQLAMLALACSVSAQASAAGSGVGNGNHALRAAFRTSPILRGLLPHRVWSFAALAKESWAHIVALAPDPSWLESVPEQRERSADSTSRAEAAAQQGAGVSTSMGEIDVDAHWKDGWAADARVLTALPSAKIPILVGSEQLDGTSLRDAGAQLGVNIRPIREVMLRLRRRPEEGAAAAAVLRHLLVTAGLVLGEVTIGEFLEPSGSNTALAGLVLSEPAQPGVALIALESVAGNALVGRELCLNLRHLLVQAMLRTYDVAPVASVSTVALALTHLMPAAKISSDAILSAASNL